MKKAIKITGGIILLIVITGFFFPKVNDFEKSLVIEAPVERIFPLVNDLKNWPLWSPWIKMEPGMEIIYGDQTAGAGAKYSWHGEELGDGSLWISESEPNKKMIYHMDFGSSSLPRGEFSFVAADGGTRVSWRFVNDNGWNPIGRLISGMFIMPMVEESYVQGLNNLREVATTEDTNDSAANTEAK